MGQQQDASNAALVHSFAAEVASGEVRLVLDTNVYLDAREAIGYEGDGYLRQLDPSSPIPVLAVIRAPRIAGCRVRFVVSPVVRGELFQLLRDGYDQCPVGLNDGRVAADLLDELTELHPSGSSQVGSVFDQMSLPNPPLADDEKNDRRIYAQRIVSDAMLVTSDRKLVDAIREQHPLRQCAALRPVELIALAKFLAKNAT